MVVRGEDSAVVGFSAWPIHWVPPGWVRVGMSTVRVPSQVVPHGDRPSSRRHGPHLLLPLTLTSTVVLGRCSHVQPRQPQCSPSIAHAQL